MNRSIWVHATEASSTLQILQSQWCVAPWMGWRWNVPSCLNAGLINTRFLWRVHGFKRGSRMLLQNAKGEFRSHTMCWTVGPIPSAFSFPLTVKVLPRLLCQISKKTRLATHNPLKTLPWCLFLFNTISHQKWVFLLYFYKMNQTMTTRAWYSVFSLSSPSV